MFILYNVIIKTRCHRRHLNIFSNTKKKKKKSKRKVQGVPQSQTAALPSHQEEEKTHRFKQAQIEQTYEKH